MHNNLINLGEHITTQKGFAFKSNWYCEIGSSIVKVSDFTDNSINIQNLTKIPDDIAVNYKQYILDIDDVIIQTVGSYPRNPNSVVGKVVRVPPTAKGALLNQNAVIIKPDNQINKKYLFYLLKNDVFKSYIIGCARGAANQASITLEDIKNFQFHLPQLRIQRKIASILSAHDDLIENNTYRIKILEEMVQRIYCEWFVFFRFPGYEKVKMVESDMGMIPDGWKVQYLKDYANFERGIEPGSKNYLQLRTDDSLPFLRVGDLGNRNSEIFVSREIAQDKILLKTDLVLSLDGTAGIVKTGLEGCYSTGIRKIIIKDEGTINQPYIKLLLQSDHIQSIIKSHARGTTILHAGSSIDYMNFILPPIKIMGEFGKIACPIMSQINNMNDKNKNLRQTRNLLLPKLISGQIDVTDLDIDTGALDA
jgi:type I restriction enzyme, S subunit